MTPLNKICRPVVRVTAWSESGERLWSRQQRNTLTYAAADLMARALTGGSATQVTYLYARFGAAPGGVHGGLKVSDVKATTRGDFVQRPTSSADPGYNVVGGLWVPKMSASISTTADVYQGNQVTYYFRIPATLPGAVEPPGNYKASSYIYALGLAVSTSSDRGQDIIISVLQADGNDAGQAATFTAFPVPAGGQVTVDYPLPFTADDVATTTP